MSAQAIPAPCPVPAPVPPAAHLLRYRATWHPAPAPGAPSAVRVIVTGWQGAECAVSASRMFSSTAHAWVELCHRRLILAAPRDVAAYRTWCQLARCEAPRQGHESGDAARDTASALRDAAREVI